ncbi:hypothetical protein QR680_018226 [Steinernema hermaphroditum]|uniref:Uncharacterized protein n=1 Tax=Steinernema hermaphroditum TaxID=289476 RepID=A0AA39HJK8_9BILA|nr:hypothetical protein QR680_018226 [Steinernema hermaphroditum]
MNSTGSRKATSLYPAAKPSETKAANGNDEITIICDTTNPNEKIRLRLKVDFLISACGGKLGDKPTVCELAINDVTVFKK